MAENTTLQHRSQHAPFQRLQGAVQKIRVRTEWKKVRGCNHHLVIKNGASDIHQGSICFLSYNLHQRHITRAATNTLRRFSKQIIITYFYFSFQEKTDLEAIVDFVQPYVTLTR